MPNVAREARTVHYAREGDGPGVILIPGLGSGSKLFGTLPRRFARAGFTCAAVDPVGIEPSSPLPGGIFDFRQAALDVLAVAAELPPPVALVGTSLGGKVALQAAATRSPSAHRLVMLCSSALRTPRALRVYRMWELLCSEVDGRLLGELSAPFLFGSTFHNRKPEVVENIIRSARPTPESRAFMKAQALALQAFDGAELCRAVQWPTLCLSGAEDILTLPSAVAAAAELIPNSICESIDGAGHSLLLESAAAFDRVVEFLRE